MSKITLKSTTRKTIVSRNVVRGVVSALAHPNRTIVRKKAVKKAVKKVAHKKATK